MKPVKTIIVSVIITLLIVALVLTIAYNSFILNILNITDVDSLRAAIVGQELFESMQQSANQDTGTEIESAPSEPVIEDTANVVPADTSTVTPEENQVVYEDNYIRVSYVKQEFGIFGPEIKFLIESKSATTVDVVFTDVHIDGYKSDVCGVYVSELKQDKKSFETLYIYETEYEAFTSFPFIVEFTIRVQDSESWNTLAESQTIYFEVQQ